MNTAKNISPALIIVAAALALTLAIASPARAASPTRENVGSIPYGFAVDCNPYGFDFSNIVQGVETLFIETVYGADGNPVKVVLHDGFVETDTNCVTEKLCPSARHGSTRSTWWPERARWSARPS